MKNAVSAEKRLHINSLTGGTISVSDNYFNTSRCEYNSLMGKGSAKEVTDERQQRNVMHNIFLKHFRGY